MLIEAPLIAPLTVLPPKIPNSSTFLGHSRPPTISPATRIWQRYAAAGALTGLVFSLPGFWGHHDLGSAQQGGWQPAALSAIFSGALAGLLMGTAGSLVWALFLSSRRLSRCARVGAAVFGSAVLVLYLLLRGGAEAFRLVNEVPFHLGTWEFLVESFPHIAVPLITEYSLAVSGLLIFVGASGFGAYRFFQSSLGEIPGRFPVLIRGLSSLFALLLLISAFSTPKMAEDGGVSRTADLSFLASIGLRDSENDDLQGEAGLGKVYVPKGARLCDGAIWESASPHLEGPRPNILLIMLESVGLQHLGYEGYGRGVTPNLDRLAASSVRFREARTTATHSNYAQMAVLSSLFPRRYSGLDTYRRLDYPRVLWHDFLSVLGYSTATYSSQDESWQGMLRFQQTATKTEFHDAGTYTGKRMRQGAELVVPDDVTATGLIQWMGKQTGPWASYVNFQSTHFPYRVPDGTVRKFRPDMPTRGQFRYLKYPRADLPIVLNRYDNALAFVDAQIGRILNALESTGRDKDTIVVVTSDHGELFFEHGLVTHGRTLFDEELRVPLLIRYPTQLPPSDMTQPVSTLDILPTIAELLDVPAHPAFQGQSVFSAEDNSERPIFMNIQGMKAADGVICGGLKFINDRTESTWELYDLVGDPQEKHNLVESHFPQAEALHDLLRSNMNAQMQYYSPRKNDLRRKFYAPRYANCPPAKQLEQVTLARSPAPSELAN